jgi:hypothetical protein
MQISTMTNMTGIVNVTIDRDHVTITHRHDETGKEVHVTIPAFKFQWIVEDFAKMHPAG